MIVTAGCGRVKRWGGPTEEFRPGDVVWFEPGERHWHGGGPDTYVSHIAVSLGATEWEAAVTEAEYARGGRET